LKDVLDEQGSADAASQRAPALPLPLLAGKALAALGLALLGAIALLGVVFTIAGGPLAQNGVACAASRDAIGAIPPRYLRLYQDTGASFGLDWAVLAAIGYVESGHGLNVGPSSAGALGPMQFLPSTWASYGVDGDGDGRANIMDPADAIAGAARLLAANGAPGEIRRALFAYNHADWYVRDVLAQAERYRGACDGADQGLGGGRLAWPVIGSVTSGFCERRAWERCHPGIDIAVVSGTAVRAAAAGTVELARPVAGYGNFVCIAHREGLATCYAHLAEYRTRQGARVARGDVIALSDCTGRCFGAHLHFEVRRAGVPVDPLPYLQGES
jgi:murein DD-endopeptidase MepM/ murein hydrolase activator NlpD